MSERANANSAGFSNDVLNKGANVVDCLVFYQKIYGVAGIFVNPIHPGFLSSWFPHNTYPCPFISFPIFRNSFFGRRELSYGDICKRIFSHHLLAGKARAMLGMVVLLGCFHVFRIFAPGFLKAVSGGFGY